MKKYIIVALCICVMLSCVGMVMQGQSQELEECKIEAVLASNNSSVSLGTATLTDKQLEGLIWNIKTEYPLVIDKYYKILDRAEKINMLTMAQILELHYYSLDENKQKEFLKDSKNQHIAIEVDENCTILISYNVNIGDNKVY